MLRRLGLLDRVVGDTRGWPRNDAGFRERAPHLGAHGSRNLAWPPRWRGPCWEWLGYRDKYGYGHTTFDRRKTAAHRLSYELFRGPIEAGLVIDHLCRNRACINPDHLQVVSQAENVRRGDSPMAANGRKTACVNGHAFDEANTRHVTWKGSARRKCRKCEAALARAKYVPRRIAP